MLLPTKDRGVKRVNDRVLNGISCGCGRAVLGGHSGALWAADDLCEPLQALAAWRYWQRILEAMSAACEGMY